ncbi:hypothetical protein PIB30_090568 [Stylosanthes scabra]|uniref:Uncharacterized protein n=1 Tax=Stylosanthes scabra TaxID=79078 RepID=A0ABU6ZT12_9FABA|nr:hypothetical protein [Stylosanthes scabra]
MAPPHPLDSAAAQPEIAKIHHHWSHRALATSYWRTRTPPASARWPWRTRAMSRRRQTATDEATPSRVRASRNLNRERGDNFPNDRFHHQIHYDRWKGMENRGVVHEQIVRINGDEELAFRNRIQGLGWRFMYDDLVRINLSIIRTSSFYRERGSPLLRLTSAAT